jgi:DNA-binding NtrC family response regulator
LSEGIIIDTIWSYSEEDEMVGGPCGNVTQCESAEAALRVLERIGGCVSMMLTDVNLAGAMDGVELAHFAARRYPNIHVIVTSGRAPAKRLPDGVMFVPKPRLPLNVMRETERSKH